MNNSVMEDIRQRFLAAISEKELDPSLTQLSKEKHNEILRSLRELPTTKKSSDYRILKRYKIADLHTNERTTAKLYKNGTNLRFVSIDEVFDVLQAVHLETVLLAEI